MYYKSTDRIRIELSTIGLGGHEYLANGRSRAFNEDSKLAVQPGYIFEGFGQERRRAVLAAAYELGINFFDATVDSEKEALGRNLAEMSPPYEVHVQTRPEGMVYTYDPYNRRMARLELLRAEARRALQLLRRDRIDFYNIAFMATALENDPDYLSKIADNVGHLKQEGLIRYASADTFSGEDTYLQEIKQGCFDAVFINLNFADDCGRRRVLPAAQEQGLGVFAREVFMKGALFQMGQDVGLTDRNKLAQVALKWVLSLEEVTVAVVGADNPAQLASNLAVLDDPELAAEDWAVIEQLKTSSTYRAYAASKRTQFGY